MKDEMAAYVKRMDVRSFSEPAKDSAARLHKFWNAKVWHVVVNVFEDCSDRCIYHSFWIEPTVAFMGPQRTRFLPLQTGCGNFFFFILYLCSTQHYTRYVHGQRVICSTPEILVTRFCNLKANASALTQNY